MLLEIAKYLIVILGVIGIGLGLYGLLGPSMQTYLANRRGAGGDPDDDDYDEFDDEPEIDIPYTQLRDLVQKQRPPGQPATVPFYVNAIPPPLAQAMDEDEDEDELDFDEILAENDNSDSRAAISIPEDIVEAEAPLVDALTGPLEADEAESEVPEPVAVAADGNDLMALFAEVEEESKTPAILREAVGTVTIDEVISEARALRELLATGSRGQQAA